MDHEDHDFEMSTSKPITTLEEDGDTKDSMNEVELTSNINDKYLLIEDSKQKNITVDASVGNLHIEDPITIVPTLSSFIGLKIPMAAINHHITNRLISNLKSHHSRIDWSIKLGYLKTMKHRSHK